MSPVYTCEARCRARAVTDGDLAPWNSKFGSPAIVAALIKKRTHTAMSATNRSNHLSPWFLGATIACLATRGAGAQPAQLPVLEPTPIEVDLSSLPAGEKAALARIVHAGRLMDALYIRQMWPGTAGLMKERETARGATAQSELAALNFFKRPWDNQDVPFIAAVPAKPPIGDFYPANSTKADIDSWLASLANHDRAQALGPFTAIRRARDGHFDVSRYSHYYARDLKLAARELQAAANLTREPTLRRYLRARAKALLDDDYFASDIAFVDLKGPIDVVLGPYEIDEDTWFGVKTAFEASIAIVNKAATERIAADSAHLQELEDHLPLAPELRGRKLGAAAPVLVLDVIYQGGLMAAGGAHFGYGLPNDLRVLNAAGARTATYRNIAKVDYQTYYAPIADVALANSARATLQFDDVVDEILMVRLFDSLGPQFVTGTTQPIADALQAKAGVAGQIRSMLLSLWGHRYLIEHGYLESRDRRTIYAAFLVPALDRVRGGLEGPRSQASTYILNHLIESGAVRADADGRFTIDPVRADAEVTRAAREFVTLMAKGDLATIEALFARYVTVSPEVNAELQRIGAAPPLQRIVYRTADELDPP
jgi:hypothetical protein